MERKLGADDKRIPLCGKNQPVIGWRIVKDNNGRYCLAAPDGEPVRLPFKIGSCELIRLYAWGGSSLIYLALDEDTGEICIIKEIYSRAQANSGAVERVGWAVKAREEERTEELRRELPDNGEADTSDELRYIRSGSGDLQNSQFILPFNEIFLDPELRDEGALNRFYKNSTYLGRTLADVELYQDPQNTEAGGRLRILDALKLTRQLAAVVRQFHEPGFRNPDKLPGPDDPAPRIHGDIQPWNIFWSERALENGPDTDRAYACSHSLTLLDFGNSHIIRNGTVDAHEQFTSSEGYSAPEITDLTNGYLPCRKPGPWSDVYSIIRVMLYMMLKDAGKCEQEYGFLECRSPSFQSLSPTEQEAVSALFEAGTEDRSINTCGELIDKLDALIDLLENRGISIAVMKKNARERAEKYAALYTIDPELLPEIESARESSPD